MPTITISKREFEKAVGKKLSLEFLKDRISYLGTDLESIDEDEINVEIFPNRPDMLSVQGFSRAFSSFIGFKKGLKKYTVKNSKEKVIIDKSVSKVRPYTACAIVKGINYTNERIKEVVQIQEKLHVTYGRNRRKAAIGIYPFEKIKPPIRFMAKKPEEIVFRPLEFQKEINARQILSKHPAGREYGNLLEGLDKFPVFIDAENKVLSVPPIINSHETGKISESTRDVFIECSGFDFNVLKKCLNIIVTALADMGGTICSMKLHYPGKAYNSPDLRAEKMKIDLGYINKKLGLDLKEKDIKLCLEKMGYGYSNKTALIPAYRADVIHQIDLAEDIAIAYGYDNFKEEIPKVATIADEDKFEIFKGRIANILVGLGLLEANTFNLTNKHFQAGHMNADIKLIELANSLSSEYNILRAWVIPSLLEVLKNNKHHDYPQNIFTIGTVFKKNEKTETKTEENDRLAVALCNEKADYTRIRQVFDYIMRSLDLKYELEETEHTSFIEGRAARVSVNRKKVAYIGEIHPKVLSNFDIIMPVAVFEINLSELFDGISS